jgi:hypothetical protein|uniref:Uncharacterized protein n=1 Tax=Myoviridae sp. ctshb19 TaxID=2825194 RepID=A0A8S5UGS2_9CAUD|nr:MAG TPA: hypothetical protein [Myoviridae sp. ctshb19]
MNVLDEVIAQLNMVETVNLTGVTNGPHVHKERVRYLLEIASDRQQVIENLNTVKVLNELLMAIRYNANNRAPDERRGLTMDDVVGEFLKKISEIQSGEM